MASKRGAPAPSDNGVKALVTSIRKRKNFRQMASYSVQCLVKLITPPAVGWEDNLKVAFDAGMCRSWWRVLGVG